MAKGRIISLAERKARMEREFYDAQPDGLKTLTEIHENYEQLLKVPDFGTMAAAQFRKKQYELWLSLPEAEQVAHTKT